MSSLLDPVGPLPRATYWRRRAIVLVVLALLIAGVVTLFNALFAGGGSPTATTTDPATPAAITGCDSKNISLTANTDQDSYAKGEKPQLTMTITNTGTTTCTFEVGSDKQKFVITSGADTIWDSTVCQTDAQPFTQQFDPGQSVTTNPLPWGRSRSDSCTAGTPAIAGGASYQLSVLLGDVQSEKTKQFMLF